VAERAVIFESRYAGHTIGFACEFAEAFAATGFNTTLVLNGHARGRPEVAEVVGDSPPFSLDWTEAFEPVFVSTEQGARELTLLAGLAEAVRPDRLVVPTGDAIARALPASAEARAVEARLPRMDVVLHHIAAAQPPKGRASFRRWRAGLAELRALHRHRILTCDAYAGFGPGHWAAWPSGVAPKYLPHLLRKRSPWDRTGARAHFDLVPEARVLVSTGDVAHRKGIDRLTAAARHPDWPQDLMLMLAGPVTAAMWPEIEAVRAAHPGRVHVIDRFLAEDEFAAAFVAADIVWAVTPGNLGVSSTFLYAARHGRPAVVAATHRSASWMCGRIGPGVPTALGPAAICAAVRKAAKSPPQTEKQAAFLDRITDSAAHERVAVGE
jgi:hypothetical protein